MLTRIYFNAVFGGLGGLLGWMLFSILSRNDASLESLSIDGALVGGVIGYFVVSVDAIRDRSWLRFVRLASYGLVLGAVGGAGDLHLPAALRACDRPTRPVIRGLQSLLTRGAGESDHGRPSIIRVDSARRGVVVCAMYPMPSRSARHL